MDTRVYNVAKELGVTPIKIIEACNSLNLGFKITPLAPVSSPEVELLRQHFSGKPLRKKEHDGTKELVTERQGEGKYNPPRNDSVTRIPPESVDQLQQPNSLQANVEKVRKVDTLSRQQFLTELLLDVDGSLERLNESSEPSARRAYVRTLFAAVEAFVSSIAYFLQEEISNAAISQREKSFIQVSIHPLKRSLSSLESIQFVVATYAYLRRCDHTFFEGEGWDAFVKAKKIRNNITHPRRARDINVSDENLGDVKNAHNWFMTTIQTIES